MTVSQPPETTPNTPTNTPDLEGEGKQDANRRYDDLGNYIGTLQPDGSLKL